jgi:hypothetical protein
LPGAYSPDENRQTVWFVQTEGMGWGCHVFEGRDKCDPMRWVVEGNDLIVYGWISTNHALMIDTQKVRNITSSSFEILSIVGMDDSLDYVRDWVEWKRLPDCTLTNRLRWGTMWLERQREKNEAKGGGVGEDNLKNKN